MPTPDGIGRVAVCEILRMTGRARDMIIDPEQTGRLREVIAEGEYYGMQTFDQALLRHYQAGRVSMEDALRVATSPHDFKLLVAGDGRTATSMDDIVSDEKSPLRPVEVPAGGAGSDNGHGDAAEQPPHREHTPAPSGPGAGASLDAAPVRRVEIGRPRERQLGSLCFSS